MSKPRLNAPRGRSLKAATAELCLMAKGMLGFWRFPEQRAEWGGPFNGQSHRVDIFRELHRIYKFRGLVETGTYRGATAEFLARETGETVWTIERDPWSYGYCFARFLFDRSINVEFGDSRTLLGRLPGSYGSPLFFYLDAHWGEDLPLRDELSQFAERYDAAVIMIDDFHVPDDPRYGFDDYGPGKRLTLDYIGPLIDRFRLKVFFPAMAAKETGFCRGCVVLLGQNVLLPSSSFTTLREYRSDCLDVFEAQC